MVWMYADSLHKGMFPDDPKTALTFKKDTGKGFLFQGQKGSIWSK